MSNEPTYEEYVERIHYSEKYSDDSWEYRHVILPKPFLKRIPKSYFDPEEPGVLRILSDAEWRGIGITQSLGWEHYEVHAPEPHILLFRREKDYQEKRARALRTGVGIMHAPYTREMWLKCTPTLRLCIRAMVPTETEFTRALADPYDVVQTFYAASRDHAQVRSAVDAHFRALFLGAAASAAGAASRIPALTTSSLRPLLGQAQSSDGIGKGVLVRWRAMVQDTGFGPELFVSVVEHESKEMTGLYGAEACFPRASEENTTYDLPNLAERSVLGAVSVPGESTWAQEAFVGRVQDDDLSSALHGLALNGTGTDGEGKRRTPIDEHPSLTVLLKIYDLDRAEQLKATEVVDVVGILGTSSPPIIEWQSAETEPSVAAPEMPCIHVLFYDRVTPESSLLPVLRAGLAQSPGPFATTAEARSALLTYLAAPLGGDALAAEFLILALIAKIHVRRPGLAVGSLSLNLSNVGGEARGATPALADALANVVPAEVNQPLRLQLLNDPAYPLYVHSEPQGLRAGRLQLPNGTCVLVDEVCMGEGTLQEQGVRNVRALASVLQSHTLAYVFPFSEFEFNTDLNVVVLSTGKSFLPVDVHVSVLGAAPVDIYARPRSAPPADAFPAWRTYLLQVRQKAFSVPDHVSAYIQNYFVERRRAASPDAYTQDDLQRGLSLARVLALSHGSAELSQEYWHMAAELDDQRRARIHARG
ncbi:hypothetical protein MSPP1_001498 [Malassezia sp. CBS 17886]|nr:hypothetical protein MSPP1_001498 [Malassezia sp. CBS 17886]